MLEGNFRHINECYQSTNSWTLIDYRVTDYKNGQFVIKAFRTISMPLNPLYMGRVRPWK